MCAGLVGFGVHESATADKPCCNQVAVARPELASQDSRAQRDICAS